MENQNMTGPYLDIVSQVSGHACSETELPLLVLESGNPNFMNLKPLWQTAQYEGTLLKCSQYYQLSCNGSIQKGSLDAALTHGMEASCNYIHMANLPGPYAECITPVKGDVSSMLRGNYADVWGGGCADKLSQIRFLDTFQLQAPDYYNNMFMYDYNSNRVGFNFHPGLVQNFSGMLPGNGKVKKETSPENMVMEKNTISEEVLAAGTSGVWDVNLPWYRETMPSSFTTFQNIGMSQLCMTALDSCGGEFIDNPVVENEGAIRVSCDVLSKANSGDSQTELHENTADLDALLSSDEEESSTGQESSTGHSPTEYSGNNKKACTKVRDNTSAGISVKKTVSNQQLHKEEEADCGPAIIEESVGESSINDNCCLFDNSLLVTPTQELDIRTKNCKNAKENEGDNKNICALSAISMLTEGSTKNSALRCRQSHKSLSGKSASAKKSKKERIKGMVQLLRNMISGEDYMDAAVVLNKTIRYVKSLQVKVNRLEANQQEKVNWV